jgi:hypothetical protein
MRKTYFICLFFILVGCGSENHTNNTPEALAVGTNPLTVEADSPDGNKLLGSISNLIYPKNLVNDPVAMKRILGKDEDNNGIRDDVDAFILTLTSSPEELKLLNRVAQSAQRSFSNKTKTEAFAEMETIGKNADCAVLLADKSSFDTDKQREKLSYLFSLNRKVRNKTENTIERTIRSKETDVLTSGYFSKERTPEKIAASCD